MGFPPNSTRRRVRSGQLYQVEFRPGAPVNNSEFIFNDFSELVSYVRSHQNQLFQTLINLKQVDWTLGFELPIDEYPLNNTLEIVGEINPDGTFPDLILNEGLTVSPENDSLRLSRVNLICRNTTTPIVTPSGRFRIDMDLATIISEGTGLLADMSNGGDFVMSAGRNSGFMSGGGNELVYIPANAEGRVFFEADGSVADDMFHLEDATASLVVFYDLRCDFGTQSMVPAASLTKQCLVQSGPTFPAETFPGKLFQLTDESNRYWMRNQDDTDWVQLAVPPTVFSKETIISATNIYAVYHTVQFEVESVRPHMITNSWKWAGTNIAKNGQFRLTIDGVPIGVNTGTTGVLIMKQQPGRAGSPPNWDQLNDGDFNYRWTPPSVGTYTIEFSFRGEDATTTIYMAQNLIRVEEVI